MIVSPYAEASTLLVLDLHAYLIQQLGLTTPFRSTDPIAGEKYGILAAQDYSPGSFDSETYLNCTFLASAGFADYWEAQRWTIGCGLTIDHMLVTAKRYINHRNLLGGVEKTGNISIGNPRAPIQQPNGQQTHVWVVDILCPLRLKLLFHIDPVDGHF